MVLGMVVAPAVVLPGLMGWGMVGPAARLEAQVHQLVVVYLFQVVVVAGVRLVAVQVIMVAELHRLAQPVEEQFN